MKDMKEHNHTPDLQKEHILEKRRKIKTQASLCDEAPRKIISKCVDDTLEPETVVSMPSYSADVQAINRAKAKVRPVYPPKPSKLSDIELPEFLKHAISRKRAEDGTEMDGETFLLHDSGVEDEDRFFMFGTEANVKNFEMAELYADGTLMEPAGNLKIRSLLSIFNRCSASSSGASTPEYLIKYQEPTTLLKLGTTASVQYWESIHWFIP